MVGRPPVERVKVNCETCGADLEKYPFQVAQNKTGRFFCDMECRSKTGSRPRRRALRTCEQCGEEFYPLYDEHARFCKKACHDAWQGRNGVMRKCENCGDEFRLPPSRAKSEAARFCKKECEGIARRKHALDREYNGKPALVDNFGYVRIYMPDHPNAYHNGWMAEHRYIAEQELDRLLTSDEHVHHVNGDKQDNRPENLVVMSHGEHSSITALANGKRLREWAEYRRRYGPLD